MRILLLAFVVALWVGNEASAGEPKDELKPAVVWTDRDSQVAERSYKCLQSVEDWRKVWATHKGFTGRGLEPPCPEVNFDAYMVVALFQGKSAQDLGLIIDSVKDEPLAIRLRYHPNWYSVLRTGKEVKGQYATTNYAFVVLPKSKKSIIIEERLPGNRFDTPDKFIWHERARLDAVK